MGALSSSIVPFATVNRRSDADYREGWQKHHLMPAALVRDPDLKPFLEALRPRGVSLDDFATNGVLLPALPSVARSAGLPLHVGGHTRYNRLVAERLHLIRAQCEPVRADAIRTALATMGVRALQAELRRAVIDHGFGTIDQVSLTGATDGDIDAMLAG